MGMEDVQGKVMLISISRGTLRSVLLPGFSCSSTSPISRNPTDQEGQTRDISRVMGASIPKISELGLRKCIQRLDLLVVQYGISSLDNMTPENSIRLEIGPNAVARQ